MFFMHRKMEFPIPIAKKLEEERQIVQKFIPVAVPQAVLDAGEEYKINSCCLNCQRDMHHYSSPYSKLRCSKFFHLQQRNHEMKLNRSAALMTQPIIGNMDRQPTEFAAIPDLGRSPPMEPISSKFSDTSYPLWLCVPSYVVDLIVIGIYAALNIICT